MPVLLDAYDALVCDLDGVVYRGNRAVDHAAAALQRVTDGGRGVVFATNNASRTPAEVAERLARFDVTADPQDVVTSAIAGARLLSSRLQPGATVLAVGGAGVDDALERVGLHPVRPDRHTRTAPDAVLQGYGAQVTAADLAEASYAIQHGAQWVITNDDLTLPTDRGIAPGNGTLVAAVRTATGQDGSVAGKPGPLLYQLAAQQLGADPSRTLGVGDRIETDVAGAHAAGMDCLHVLTGVHHVADLVRADPHLRPRFVAADLRALHSRYDEPRRDGTGWHTGAASARVTGSGDDAAVACSGDGATAVEVARVVLAALWEALDQKRIDSARAVALLPEQAVA